jgi:KUP system potassium uptake protein
MEDSQPDGGVIMVAIPFDTKRQFWPAAALACMGVVFGDIGTSPLYTLQVATKTASIDGTVAPEAVLGIVSLIFWSLIIVISIKYAILIMRADNHGEGGILALLALVSPRRAKQSRRRAVIVVIGLVGATLLYGDGTITPAISVLSALEGLKVYTPQMGRLVVPLTVLILVLLFLIQRRGTSWIGGIFGPVMLIWFIVIGALGVAGIAKAPAVLAALSPMPAITYLWHAGPLALPVIGGAFLAVTGGEAFYADMGHFGPFPIRVAWFGVALPALTLNYFGQGGLLITEPHAVENSFFQLAPEWTHYGLVSLATVATVIASQSIISGAYSMTQQAIQLGFLPRMNIIHTAGHEIGQIYVPFVNWMLAVGTLAAVIGFGSSDALAGAFGIAVSLMHRTRHLFIRQQIGIVAPVGRKGVEDLLRVVADPKDKRVPKVARPCVAALGAQLRMLKIPDILRHITMQRGHIDH